IYVFVYIKICFCLFVFINRHAHVNEKIYMFVHINKKCISFVFFFKNKKTLCCFTDFQAQDKYKKMIEKEKKNRKKMNKNEKKRKKKEQQKTMEPIWASLWKKVLEDAQASAGRHRVYVSKLKREIQLWKENEEKRKEAERNAVVDSKFVGGTQTDRHSNLCAHVSRSNMHGGLFVVGHDSESALDCESKEGLHWTDIFTSCRLGQRHCRPELTISKSDATLHTRYWHASNVTVTKF
ncbi:hypothetical protein RFI_29463, partial [Reticulomyxa filosa]